MKTRCLAFSLPLSRLSIVEASLTLLSQFHHFYDYAVNIECYKSLFSCPVCYKLFLGVKCCRLRDAVDLTIVPVIPIPSIKVSHPMFLAPVAASLRHLFLDAAVGKEVRLELLQELL